MWKQETILKLEIEKQEEKKIENNEKEGIPFGSVNLLHGVDENESKITSTVGGGTSMLEFGVLSRLTGNPTLMLRIKEGRSVKIDTICDFGEADSTQKESGPEKT